MTKNQRSKLVSQIATFIITFSVMMVCAPYVFTFIAIYFAVEAARRI